MLFLSPVCAHLGCNNSNVLHNLLCVWLSFIPCPLVLSLRACIRQSPTDGEGSRESDWRRSQRQQLPVYQREVCHHQEHWSNYLVLFKKCFILLFESTFLSFIVEPLITFSVSACCVLDAHKMYAAYAKLNWIELMSCAEHNVICSA